MASIMLAAFAVRALIPLGFMPASGRPFSLEICWEGLPGDMLADGERAHAGSMGMDSMGMDSMPAAAHHHSGTPSHSEHCVFGTACGAGPIPHLPLPIEISSVRQLRGVPFVSIAGAVRLVHLPQSRAPPALPGQLS